MFGKQNIILTLKQKGITATIGVLFLVLLIAVPFLVIVFHTFSTAGENESLLFSLIRSDIISNSFYLVFFIILLSLVLGVGSAWLVTQYDFTGKKFLEWALILPITIPTYIMAFTYVGILNYTGTLQGFLKNNFSDATAENFRFDVITPFWLIVFLSLALYPYVYLAARVAFVKQSGSAIEAARSLGSNKWNLFSKIAMPLARPAIIGGCILVGMEVLNDYGAMAFFGIPTFTTAISHAWQIDIRAALILASYLFIAIFLLIYIERKFRGRKGFAENIRNSS
jgi:iron(III) transport system permease protein